MFSSKEMPSPSSIFSAYASVAASAMLFRSMANELVPKPARAYLVSALRRLFKSAHSPKLTLVIEDSAGMSRNQLFDAASEYLSSKLSPGTERLKVSKSPKDKSIRIHLEKGEKVSDSFDGLDLAWTFVVSEPASGGDQHPLLRQQERRSFELSFDKRQRQRVLDSYLPFVLEQAREARDRDRVLKMHTLSGGDCGSARWESVGMEHPATFETVAMEGEAKAALVADLERFVKRKEFYRRVGRAWKRGYLLHGPPGTGKSSLVAAIANHLRFDVYDLQLANVTGDSDLRKLLLSTANRSILVIEDIDCSADLPDLRRRNNNNTTARPDRRAAASTLTLSGLLNFIDGLWSSCGDERIIIFTTNHKDRLDPALLRPGRMDMHIHMSYCSFDAFKLLASNYLGICGVHALFAEIEDLIGEAEVTPAQVAEELMRSDDPDAALDGLVQLLKRKRSPVDYEENHTKRRRIAAKNNNNNKKKRVVGLRRRGGLRSDK